MIFILLLSALLCSDSWEIKNKHCNNYCCDNILYFVTKDIGENGLNTTRHGNNCPVLNNIKASKIRAIIKHGIGNDDLICVECKGKNLDYGDKCNAWCCNHYEYVVDFSGGLIHSLDCKAIRKMPIYDAMFKNKNYDLIDGAKKNAFSGLCLFCLGSFARMN